MGYEISTCQMRYDAADKKTDLIPKTRRCRNQHSMAFQTPIANTDVYKGSFFPQTIRDWNALPDSRISSEPVAPFILAVRTVLSVLWSLDRGVIIV